jgi:hypothetical protein
MRIGPIRIGLMTLSAITTVASGCCRKIKRALGSE